MVVFTSTRTHTHGPLYILEGNRKVRNSLVSLAVSNGVPLNRIKSAGSIKEFKMLLMEENSLIRGVSRFILDINLPDGKSSQIIEEFGLTGDIAIFSAMKKDYFTEFKTILENSSFYEGRVFPKEDPYGVLVCLGISTEDKRALEEVHSVSTSIGVAVESLPNFAVKGTVPNPASILKLINSLERENVVVNIVSDRELTLDDKKQILDLKVAPGKSRVNFIYQADFLGADLNIVICNPKEITTFSKAYQSMLSHAMHVDEPDNIKNLAQLYLQVGPL